MTPGPTQVAENVRMARMKECTNPDLDTSFCEFCKDFTQNLGLPRSSLEKYLCLSLSNAIN